MLSVTLRAARHVGMKSSRPALKDRLIIGVTDRAVDSFSTLPGRMARTAIVIQELSKD